MNALPHDPEHTAGKIRQPVRPRKDIDMLRRCTQTLLGALLFLVPSLPLLAQDAMPTHTEKGLQIEEVLVTVSKRSESLQDVLGSVSALSGETIADNNVQDFRTLAALVPGMVVQREEVGGDEVAIRGISRTRDGPSPVAFHINDVFIDLRGEPYYDLAAVEIIRGPSGTAYGRNATAGAINAKWRQPELEWSAGGELRYSALVEKELKAYLNVPLLGEGDDRLLARIAALSRDRDGTLDNLLESDDADPNNIHDRFLRVYLTSVPVDSLQIGIRAIYYKNETRGTAIVFSPSLAARESGNFEEFGAQPMSSDITEVRSRASELYGPVEDEFTRVTADITWSLEQLPLLGNMDIVAVGGEQRRVWRSVFDLDGTEVAIIDGQADHLHDIRRSAELRFVSQNDQGFDWLLGFFNYRKTDEANMDIEARQFVSPATVGLPAVPGAPAVPAQFRVTTRGLEALDHSKAVFLNMNLDLAQLLSWPHIELSAGVRVNRDKFKSKTARSDTAVITPSGPIDVINQRNIRQFAEFEETTGEVGARWFYGERGMVYAKLARGYKPGLAQRVETLDQGVIQNPVDPEFLDALEIGWKASFLAQTLQTNMALFYYNYQDLQVSQITPGGVITENAAEATIRGFELDARWMPTASLEIQGAFAWTDATYDSYCGNDPTREEGTPEPGCNEENPFNFSGETLTAAPRYSASLLASYRFELGDFGSLTPSLQTSWSDELSRRGLGNDADIVESHSNSSLRLTWKSLAGGLRVTAFVENIEDNNDLFFSAAPMPVGADRPNLLSLFGNLPPRYAGISMAVTF